MEVGAYMAHYLYTRPSGISPATSPRGLFCFCTVYFTIYEALYKFSYVRMCECISLSVFLWSSLSSSARYYILVAMALWQVHISVCLSVISTNFFWKMHTKLLMLHLICSVLFCSLAVLNPRVGHTMDVLSPFISLLGHSDWLLHGESCPCLDVVHPGRAWSSSPLCTWHCFLHFFLQATPLFPHGVTIVC